jgi:hypothetical protein
VQVPAAWPCAALCVLCAQVVALLLAALLLAALLRQCFAVVFALVIITYFGDEIAGFDTAKIWSHVLMVCMIALTVVISVFNIMAIIRNIRLGKRGES